MARASGECACEKNWAASWLEPAAAEYCERNAYTKVRRELSGEDSRLQPLTSREGPARPVPKWSCNYNVRTERPTHVGKMTHLLNPPIPVELLREPP